MPKVVVLDTSAFRRAKLRSADLQNLFGLSASGAVAVCIPRIALNEWRTQFRDALAKSHENMKSRISDFFVGGLLSAPTIVDLQKFSEIVDTLVPEELSEGLAAAVVDQYKLVVLEVADNHAEAVFDKYFAGTGCFHGRVKNRTDLPDAFVYEAVASLVQQSDVGTEIAVVAHDDNLREAVLRDMNLKCFKSLAELMGSDLLNAEQRKYDYESGWERVVESIAIESTWLKEKIAQHEESALPYRLKMSGTFSLPESFRSQDYVDFGVSRVEITDIELEAQGPGWYKAVVFADLHGHVNFSVSRLRTH